jgi:predicted DNA-binding transcriptional regulator AlpA
VTTAPNILPARTGESENLWQSPEALGQTLATLAETLATLTQMLTQAGLPAMLTAQREPPAELMDAVAVAGMLDCSERHVQQMGTSSRDGFPRPIKFGRSTKWRRADVLKWVASRKPC